jgi:hypothetical protein
MMNYEELAARRREDHATVEKREQIQLTDGYLRPTVLHAPLETSPQISWEYLRIEMALLLSSLSRSSHVLPAKAGGVRLGCARRLKATPGM